MILITGATGNNGRELVRQLTVLGQGVRAFVRNPAEASHLKGPNIELAVGDFDQPETLDTALRDVEKAFLLTPVAERFVHWQTIFIEAARRAGVKHLVKFSGMGADFPTAPELLRLHRETDDRLRGSGVPFTILRPNSFHQNIYRPPTPSKRRVSSTCLSKMPRKARWTSETLAQWRRRY